MTEVDGLDGIFPLTASARCIMGRAIPAGRRLKAIGKTVQVRRGPAAVTGDKGRSTSLSFEGWEDAAGG